MKSITDLRSGVKKRHRSREVREITTLSRFRFLGLKNPFHDPIFDLLQHIVRHGKRTSEMSAVLVANGGKRTCREYERNFRVLTDSVEKRLRCLSFGSLLEHLRDSIGLFTYSFGCGVPPLMRRGHHNPSCKTGHRFVRSRPPDVLCQRLQVLRNGCEVELVARAPGRVLAGAHAFEPNGGSSSAQRMQTFLRSSRDLSNSGVPMKERA